MRTHGAHQEALWRLQERSPCSEGTFPFGWQFLPETLSSCLRGCCWSDPMARFPPPPAHSFGLGTKREGQETQEKRRSLSPAAAPHATTAMAKCLGAPVETLLSGPCSSGGGKVNGSQGGASCHSLHVSRECYVRSVSFT